MKKIFSEIAIFWSLLICVIAFPNQVLATDQFDVNNNSGETIYLKTYEEYENLMNTQT